MVLQALNGYYKILIEDPDTGIAPFGYCSTGVSFALNLSPQGILLNILPLFEQVQRGKKVIEAPLRMLVPEQVKRSSGISANFLCDNSAYVLGLSGKKEGDLDYGQKRFDAFRELHLTLLKNVDSEAAKAVKAFLNSYSPKQGLTHPEIATHLEAIMAGGNLVFKLNGSQGYIHQDPAIRRSWEEYRNQTNETLGRCLVTGETLPIARLHPSLKGVRDANATGAPLVGFNAPAYESYYKEQGDNSPVSEKAAFAYTTVLNYLLSSENKNRKFTIGDATVVYWAESSDPIYGELFSSLFGIAQADISQAEKEDENSAGTRDIRAEQLLAAIGEKVQHAKAVDLDGLDGLDGSTRFYVLGLSPNAGRISIRFFYQDPFQKMVEKIMGHYRDMENVKEFDNQPRQIPIWQILNETVSRKSTDKSQNPLLAGALFMSILNDSPYPAALFYTLINRIRADADDGSFRKINYIRASAIKAYLIRKYRYIESSQMKEVLTMSLNESSTHPAYLLGRLFAVLEKAQQEAIGDVNASIKDRYFTSACASPASVFPQLLRLSQHHISKAEYGYVSDRRIEQIMNLLDVSTHPIPTHLTLDEQGIFILGYYHQRAAFYVSKNNVNSAEKTPGQN